MALKEMEALAAQALGQFKVREVAITTAWAGWRSAKPASWLSLPRPIAARHSRLAAG